MSQPLLLIFGGLKTYGKLGGNVENVGASDTNQVLVRGETRSEASISERTETTFATGLRRTQDQLEVRPHARCE